MGKLVVVIGVGLSCSNVIVEIPKCLTYICDVATSNYDKFFI